MVTQRQKLAVEEDVRQMGSVMTSKWDVHSMPSTTIMSRVSKPA